MKAPQSRLLFASQVHRLVVVDEQEVVRGIVSLSDILQALVLTDRYAGESSRSFVGLRRLISPSQCLIWLPQAPCKEVTQTGKGCIFSKGGQDEGGERAGTWIIITERPENHLPFTRRGDTPAIHNCKGIQQRIIPPVFIFGGSI